MVVTPALGADRLDDRLAAELVSAGLLAADEPFVATSLAGGVSSQIWKVQGARTPFCVKRALAQLKVPEPWTAPLERNAVERDWCLAMADRFPGIAPRVLAFGADNWFAMEYFSPALCKLWKHSLLAGSIDIRFAALVGATLAAAHRISAGDSALRNRFATDQLFTRLRLDPYLRHAGRSHPDLAPLLEQLIARSLSIKRALVHGDISPKNILDTPTGPVFLDAECAWYGDPSFDLAFCLNHLLLKCVAAPARTREYLASFDALAAAYLTHVTWESVAELETRASTLLPALMLARVDGKSPIEYLTRDEDRQRVRRVARAALLSPRNRLSEVKALWEQALCD